MSKKEKKKLIKIIISTILLLIFSLIKINNTINLVGFLIIYIIIGYDIIKKSIKNIINGQIFDENFLMTIATIGALILGENLEAIMVMLLYQIGELFQSYAVGKSRKSISDLMDIRPEYAGIEKEGKIIQIFPEELKIDDIIIVKPGEKIPIDGIVIDGNGTIDTAALTGESIPREVEVGNEVISGCINLNSTLKIKVTKIFEESAVSKILNLVENASNKKAKTEKFITKFAKYYTPIVVVLAVLLTIVPSLVLRNRTIIEWLKRALTFLVISCPCALVISVPLGFFGGIGGASKKGILIKGSNYMETLAKVKTIVFDKTGTLTKGAFEVQEIHSNNISKEQLLEIAALAEIYSNHPIASSIKKACKKDLNKERVQNIEEIAGKGIKAIIDDREIYVGNAKLMNSIEINIQPKDVIGTVIHIAGKNKYLGYIVIADEIKQNSKKAIEDLKNINKIQNIVMITGDNKNTAKHVGKELEIDKVYYEMLPIDKVEKVEEILGIEANRNVVFVGDGINDAPVLTRADIGIAMGALGSDAAIEAADIVIMDDNIQKINEAIAICKKTLKIVKQNIVFALGVKILFLTLGAMGITSMMGAIFADVGVSVIAILNSMRTLNYRK